jgi:hypothetical protein
MTARKLTDHKKRTTAAQLKPHWRNFSDAAHAPFKKLPCAQSLRPDARVSQAYVERSPVARAIIAAWRPCLAWQSLIRVEELAA